MCWFGINNPTFKWEFLKWKDAISLDTGYTEIGYVNIAMTIDGTELYTNTSYQVKIHFDKTLSKNLFHSTASFYGDGEFSNVKADLNDMTANVCFKTNANHEIYGRLDHQIVKLARTTENKLPSEVHITSCENVTYGHPVKVTFTTVNGSLKDITYEVKNSEGTVVKHGKVYPYSYLSIELGPGTYTVTIINPETSQYLGSSDNATFTVSRGNLYLDLDIPDEIYPETVECSIEGNNRGDCNCNLTIVGDNGPVYSQIITVHSADYYGGANHYNIGVLLPRIYEATLSYPGDNNYEPFTTSKRFTVSTTGTSFEIEITPGEIEYGSNATVMHVISPDATGSIRYYLKNGTFLGEKPVGENFILPLLDAGSYVIMANYTGDAGHNSASDIAKVVVRKTNPEFGIRIIPVGYGDNATVTHTLPDAATGTIIYYLENGTFLGELSVNENLTLPAWEVKTCLIIANYSGNRNFLNATANATLVINILKTEIIAEPVITTYKDDDYLVILLKDENGNKMAYFNVTVDLKGEENYMTDENGQIKISTADLGADTYDVHILFRGTPNYMNSSNATQIFVNIRPSIMTTTPLVTIYQVHKYLVVNLKDDAGNPISNMDTFITINGVTYPCKTDSAGDAKLIIRLDPKEYIATAVFDNANYTMSLEFTKVTVHKATPKMTAKSKKFKTSKKVKKYTVTLKDNVGKAIKNVKIILKVKGKKYTVRTNSKGKATFKIKNLKKKGKYKATVTYAGNFRFNKVTKKVTITCTK